ncbi:hypothetical protein PRZ48_008838 [Zasmidium cellare]|uniref:Uncharacterized protein n=1 Tax=Zasmidium cellare TaxID=395010 RepID=A0ABR0EGM7_ZASCE|nr:hypothetical protein PRZ48_008838 [Zasmidium cellare]
MMAKDNPDNSASCTTAGSTRLALIEFEDSEEFDEPRPWLLSASLVQRIQTPVHHIWDVDGALDGLQTKIDVIERQLPEGVLTDRGDVGILIRPLVQKLHDLGKKGRNRIPLLRNAFDRAKNMAPKLSGNIPMLRLARLANETAMLQGTHNAALEHLDGHVAPFVENDWKSPDILSTANELPAASPMVLCCPKHVAKKKLKLKQIAPCPGIKTSVVQASGNRQDLKSIVFDQIAKIQVDTEQILNSMEELVKVRKT